MTEDVELPQQFSHSIKFSETAKGVRIDVHVYSTDRHTAVGEAIAMYIHAKEALTFQKIPLAPVEVNGK